MAKIITMLFAVCVTLLVVAITPVTTADVNTDNPNVLNDILAELKEIRKDKHECNKRLDELEKQLTSVKDVKARLELAELRIQELESIRRHEPDDDKEQGEEHIDPSAVNNNKPKRGISRIRQLPGEAVAFTAGVSPQMLPNLGVHHTIIFDKAITNVGNAYHTTTGIFTAPYAGIYVFDVRGMEDIDHTLYLELIKDGMIISDLYLDSKNDHIVAQSKLFTLQLNKGSEVWVRTKTPGSLHGYMHSMFSGFLLFPME